MKNLVLFYTMFSFFYCCPSENLINSKFPDKFLGTWHAGGHEEATLNIYLAPDDTYRLEFENEDFQWEGLGYRKGKVLIAIFRYLNVDEIGYVTFTLINEKKINYTSRNSDGSVRVKGYYFKL